MNSQEFVLPIPTIERERRDLIDVYRPDVSDRLAPVVVFVHGGPIPPGHEPRDKPIFIGYASLVAHAGAVGVMFNHRLHSASHLSTAADDLREAVNQARSLPGVDPDRVAIWFFSGAGLLMADWLREPPRYLRCLAATYPVLESGDDWGVEERFRPVEAVATAGRLPVLVTRVGRERPEFAQGGGLFVNAARAAGVGLDVIDVPNGQHGFDILDHTDESRDAVRRAVDWVIAESHRPAMTSE
ncbi:MAG: alpha/beta hydrolase [Nocardiaceae bacterium]|nr:alpha/beta hydrolase [Nocardiaceae bacterium]